MTGCTWIDKDLVLVWMKQTKSWRRKVKVLLTEKIKSFQIIWLSVTQRDVMSSETTNNPYVTRLQFKLIDPLQIIITSSPRCCSSSPRATSTFPITSISHTVAVLCLCCWRHFPIELANVWPPPLERPAITAGCVLSRRRYISQPQQFISTTHSLPHLNFYPTYPLPY